VRSRRVSATRCTAMRRIVVAASVAAAVLSPVALASGQTLDDLDDAEEEVAGLEVELERATAAYEATWATIEAGRAELGELEVRARHLETEATARLAAIGDRARSVYIHGSTASFQMLFSTGGPQRAIERAALVSTLQSRDRVRVEDALATRIALAQVRQLVEHRQGELDRLQIQLEADAEVLQARLAAAEDAASSIRSVVHRQRRIDRGGQQGIYACIFDRGAFRFRDTWGAPRSGGRRHKGTDVFAATNAPTYAITAGVVQRHSSSALGGLGLYLRGDDGNVYYYSHLNSIESGGRVGNRVAAGELIARNGSTGNASPNAPHVHFELHPGGGAAVNPYPWLAAACF
jgi:murein DD-endopeptidase MepM/ murein hydrolase activator NlpD